jgi:aromatic-L-amino-acid decarboxylase
MADTDPGHMSAEEFRAHGHTLVDWVADLLRDVERRPVQATVEPGEVRRKIPSTIPQEGEPFAALLADLDDVVLPGITDWQHPGWFAYFPTGAAPQSVLAELVSAALGAQGMLWSTSPALTEVETAMMDWLVELLGLPSAWRMDTGPGGGVLQMSASDSTHTALVVARHQATRGDVPSDQLVVYVSAQAHSSVEKGASVAGYRHLRLIDVDDAFALRPDALADAVATDVAAGLVPAFVCSAVGTTATTAIDPVRTIGELARAHGMWHHVDAAYAGAAMVCPELRHHQDGLDLVDSYTFNPHKWLLVNFDCSAFWVADRGPLLDTLSILPPYLRNPATESGEVVDYRDWHVPLGRRFRALKLWWVLRSYGRRGLQAHIRRHIGWAHALEDRVVAHERLALVAPTPFALVSFRHVEGNDATRTLAATVNARDDVLVMPSEIDGTAFIRVSIGATPTEWRHVASLWDMIAAAA